MTVGAELLAEIWKRPTDRAAIGVYADWLASQGDAPRAEFIQLSLLDRRTAAQEDRRIALRNRHRGAWLGAARPFVYTWHESEESPGFVASVQCSMAKLTKGFEHVRALGPRLEVHATQPKAKREVVALSKLPLGTVWGLSLIDNDAQWITDEVLTILGPALKGLRSLTLRSFDARSSDRGWRAMLPHLDALEHLELSLGENPEQWLEAILESSLVGTLVSLSLPSWIDRPLRTRLTKKLRRCTIELQDGPRYRFNRALGYYELG